MTEMKLLASPYNTAIRGHFYGHFVWPFMEKRTPFVRHLSGANNVVGLIQR